MADSWEPRYAELHHGIINGSTPAGARRYLLWTCGQTFLRQGCTLKAPSCNCVGYANRLIGMASAFLAALITERAFLIAWPGEEAVQLSNYFKSDLVDWRLTDERFEQLGIPRNQTIGLSDPTRPFETLSSSHLGELEIVQPGWASKDLLQLINGQYGDVVLLFSEKADFRDIFLSGHHDEDLARLGLVHVDQVMGLLARLLQPTGALAEAVSGVQASLGPCHVVGIQVRIAEEARSLLPLSRGHRFPGLDWSDAKDKVFLTMEDLPRFAAAAQALEDAALNTPGPDKPTCVKWLLITDEPEVVRWFLAGGAGSNASEKASMRKKIVYCDVGPIAHMSHVQDSAAHLKVVADHWLFATADDAVLSAPSSFGLTALAMNLHGRPIEFVAVFAELYHHAEVPCVARAITEAYRCAPDGRDECFCNYWGFSGHMCDSALIRHQLHMCPDCAVMEFPMCQCEILRPPFCSTNLTMSVVSSSSRRSLQPGSMRLAEASGGGTNDVAADSSCPANVVNESSAERGGNTGAGTGSALAEATVGELRIHDLPADLFASCSFYIFRVFVGDTAFIREYAAVVCAS